MLDCLVPVKNIWKLVENIGKQMFTYPLVNWPIEIVDLPIKNGNFHRFVYVYQKVINALWRHLAGHVAARLAELTQPGGSESTSEFTTHSL